MAVDLISCRFGVDDILGVYVPDLSTYIGDVIEVIDGDETNTYQVQDSLSGALVDLGAVTVNQVDECDYNSFNLTSCNAIYPSIEGVISPDLTAYIGKIISLGNPTKGYTVSLVENQQGFGSLEDYEITELSVCPPCVNFDTRIKFLEDDCNCNSILFKDDSVFENSIEGHELWGYRRVVVTSTSRQYVLSSNVDDEHDGFIPVYTEGGQVEFSYPIVAGDTDGVFTFELYNIPLWQADVYYNKLINHLVYKDGVIYKVKESNSGENPSMPGSELYWDVYELDESIFTTRYAEKRRKAVTCISLDCCGSGLVVDAFCSNTVSPCGDVSENKAYQQAMKYNVIREAVIIMECKNDWSGVEKGIEMLKKICSCGSCK